MVKTKLCFLFFVYLCMANGHLVAADVTVSAEMNDYNLTEGQPLKGTVTVTHDRSVPIDVSSFKIGNKPLNADYIKDVRISENSPLTISIYNFELPSQPKGLYILDPISVKVGGKIYQSFKVSYQVNAPAESPTSTSSAPPPAAPPQPLSPPVSRTPELKLEAKVQGPTTLYPGERTTLVYRFLFTGNIDLTKEVLPMLDAKDFKKIGDKQHQDLQEGDYSVSQFSQEIEATKAGTYTYGPSFVEGNAYSESASGQKTYLQKLQSEAPAITLTVLSPPDTQKPGSYNGAIGKFTYDVQLASEPEVSVGDKIRLLIQVNGAPENLQTFKAPDLCCQPGFSGMFRPSDLPPQESWKGNSKSFVIELRPLSEAVKEIPSIEFSSFNPETGKYEIEHSSPIPIKVVSIQSNQENLPAFKSLTNHETTFPKLETVPFPIEITGIYVLVPSDLTDVFGGSLWTLLWIPIAAIFIYAQASIKKDWEENKSKQPQNKAQELFKKALAEKEGSPESFNYLRESLLLLLEEKGLIESTTMGLEKMPDNGLVGEVKAFIAQIDEMRFAGKAPHPNLHLNGQAQKLFNKINQSEPSR